MSAIRSKTVLFLLFSAMLLTIVPFALPTSAGHALGAASCHEDSAPTPTEQTPQNHDCCSVGHLHATAIAPLSIVPDLALAGRTICCAQDPARDSQPLVSPQRIDTSPPGVPTPIRI
ncbi:MAG TPA: hypothetical protein VM912_23765 [Terriglobales bacterium]|nr:hypothetical protein [Terriglobales bacterium]